jgi:hypothetical protein
VPWFLLVRALMEVIAYPIIVPQASRAQSSLTSATVPHLDECAAATKVEHGSNDARGAADWPLGSMPPAPASRR